MMAGTKAATEYFLKELAKLNRSQMSQMLRQLTQEQKRRKNKIKSSKK